MPFVHREKQPHTIIINNKYYHRSALTGIVQIFVSYSKNLETDSMVVAFDKSKPAFAVDCRDWKDNVLATRGKKLGSEETNQAIDDFIQYALKIGVLKPVPVAAQQRQALKKQPEPAAKGS